jgi:hypothetical protein
MNSSYKYLWFLSLISSGVKTIPPTLPIKFYRNFPLIAKFYVFNHFVQVNSNTIAFFNVWMNWFSKLSIREWPYCYWSVIPIFLPSELSSSIADFTILADCSVSETYYLIVGINVIILLKEFHSALLTLYFFSR